jgi:hypothetical protein
MQLKQGDRAPSSQTEYDDQNENCLRADDLDEADDHLVDIGRPGPVRDACRASWTIDACSRADPRYPRRHRGGCRRSSCAVRVLLRRARAAAPARPGFQFFGYWSIGV